MYERSAGSIREHIPLTNEELDICKTLFQPKKMRKKLYLRQEGDICKYTAFVEKGLLRSFAIDNKGGEHILQFALEGRWIADLYSFFTNEPSQYNIVGEDWFLAFSPERVDPGREDFTTINTPKVMGGITPACSEVATAWYEGVPA